eukprot:scaffold38339_cov62-Phaeocystis_antarctica.AAC.2
MASDSTLPTASVRWRRPANARASTQGERKGLESARRAAGGVRVVVVVMLSGRPRAAAEQRGMACLGGMGRLGRSTARGSTISKA